MDLQVSPAGMKLPPTYLVPIMRVKATDRHPRRSRTKLPVLPAPAVATVPAPRRVSNNLKRTRPTTLPRRYPLAQDCRPWAPVPDRTPVPDFSAIEEPEIYLTPPSSPKK